MIQLFQVHKPKYNCIIKTIEPHSSNKWLAAQKKIKLIQDTGLKVTLLQMQNRTEKDEIPFYKTISWDWRTSVL